MSTIAIVISILALFFAAVSAIAAWRSVSVARKANQGTLVEMFMEQYDEPDMCQAIRILGQLPREYGKNFAEVWKQKLKEKDKKAQNADNARRKLSHYFQRLFGLYELDIIENRVITFFGKYEGVHVFLGIVEPMEYELNESYDKSAFKCFRRLRRIPSKVDTEIPPE